MATEKAAAPAAARLHGAHGHGRRPRRVEPPSLEGQASADGLTPSQPSVQHSGHTLRREQRLRRRSDFEALQEHGTSRAHPLLVLRASPNSLPYSRFGFVVGRRVTKEAVTRNRVRRRLREVVRQTPVQPGWDLLFIARPKAAEAPFAALQQAVWDLERRANLLVPGGS